MMRHPLEELGQSGGQLRRHNKSLWIAVRDNNNNNNYATYVDFRVPFIRNGLISTGMTDKTFQNSSASLTGVNILEVGCGAGILTEVHAFLQFILS